LGPIFSEFPNRTSRETTANYYSGPCLVGMYSSFLLFYRSAGADHAPIDSLSWSSFCKSLVGLRLKCKWIGEFTVIASMLKICEILSLCVKIQSELSLTDTTFIRVCPSQTELQRPSPPDLDILRSYHSCPPSATKHGPLFQITRLRYRSHLLQYPLRNRLHQSVSCQHEMEPKLLVEEAFRYNFHIYT
jgi:hypothetical protein